jgi:ATP-dependent helicase/nuclease subunit A
MQILKRNFDVGSGATLDDPGRVLAKVICEEPPLVQKSAKPARHNLQQVIEKARQLSAAGEGEIPAHMGSIPVDGSARKHYSFSRLQGTLHPREYSGPRPPDDEAAAAGPALDPLGLGSLVHAVLADLTAQGDASRVAVDGLVRKHAWQHLPNSLEQLDEPIDLVMQLAASPRWAAVRAASKVYTELEFLLAWPPGSQTAESPYIQGFIDCLYQDQRGGWHLLDYKTNQVTRATLAETAGGYEMQMMVYALAVEQILKRPPVEIVLHFLRGNLEQRFTWDLLARDYAKDLVNEAMAKLV